MCNRVNDFDSGDLNSTPLRLTGGGDTSFLSEEEVSSTFSQHTVINEGLDASQVLNENDLLSLVDQDNSMSEQDIRDVLFEAGYNYDEINDIMAAKANAGLDASNSLSPNESDASEIGSTLGSDPSADEVLKEIRIKNVNRVTIGTLNINSLAPKFEQLKMVIGKNLDILTIQETKLDSSFPSGQFILDGYSEPYRLDRNRNGGGVIIYVREDIPSKLQTYFHKKCRENIY